MHRVAAKIVIAARQLAKRLRPRLGLEKCHSAQTPAQWLGLEPGQKAPARALIELAANQSVEQAGQVSLRDDESGIHSSSSLIPDAINSCRNRVRARVSRASTPRSEIPSRSAICR